MVTSGTINVGASATAIVSAAGTITSIDITNAGSGYNSATVKISSPLVGVATFIQSDGTVGVATTATATATITNGAISAINVTNAGFGYSNITPPQVIIDLPTFETEKITSISNVEGFTGIITGISTVTNSGQSALKFFFTADKEANSLLVNYPVFISDTVVGNGIISVDTHNSSVVGIGSTFLDNIYKVHAINTLGRTGEITCNIQNGQVTGVGAGLTGNYDNTAVGIATHLGRISWGRLYNVSRANSPISIGVTGLTVNSGLTTFPTIQRKNYTAASLRGLRSSGAIRVFGL